MSCLSSLRRGATPSAMIFTSVLFLVPVRSMANHGPGASGGGSAVISGETLNQGKIELSLREDYTQFERFSEADAAARAAKSGDFDALERGFLTTVDVAYGVTDEFQVGGSIGYFVGDNFVSADRAEDGSVEVGTADPQGLTDLVLSGKYRLLRGQPGNLAVVVGVVVPTGRDDVRLSSGETIHPSDQPGTGRWGLPIGVGYSRFLTKQLTVDASALYTFRFERNDFKVGDRFDAGVAFAYRLTESIRKFPQFSVFGEVNNVWLQKDREGGADDPNSGGDILYLTPGFRVRFDPHVALTVAPSFPVVQNLNGEQGDVEFKVAIALTYAL